jgi:hypothetical protein
MYHLMVVEEARDLSSAGEHRTGLEGSVRFLHHLLTKYCPRVGMNGEDDKDLEWVEALEGSSGWRTRRDERGQLHKTAASTLDFT